MLKTSSSVGQEDRDHGELMDVWRLLIRCRSDDDVNSHQALEAYSSLAKMTDL